MKNLICVLAISTISFAAMATDQTSSVCTDPLQRVCKDTEVQRKARDLYVANLKQEIAKEAAQNAIPRIEEMKSKISKIHFIKRMIQSFKIRNQEIMNSAKRRIGDIESVVTSEENIKKLKTYMAEAIDASKFDDATKTKFKGIMSTVIIGNFNDFIERTGLEDNALAQLLNTACGTDGLIDNAFATEINKERYVLVCPGFLITLSQTASATDRFNSILHAISHEMGHHIDNSKVGEELYAPYLTCLSNNYADKFKRSKADQKFCDKKAKNAAECNQQVVKSHAGELIADAWGLNVTNIHMRAEQYSSIQVDQLLTDSWAKLCGSGDEGIHPSGDFRIGTLMRTNPDITEYLGCNNSQVNIKPACTLEGATNI
jgi:hypothetical protein